MPDLSKIPEPVPKDEPHSQYGNKSPYSVLGETYRVLPSCKDYVERGLASWYGNKFHGYATSDFEHYDMYAYSAAHKTLPLPCYVRVTNLETGRSAIVRVNDRGPFVANRIIDLSYVAAVKVGVWPKGTAMVEVRGIDPAHPQTAPEHSGGSVVSAPASAAPTPQKTPKPGLYLQVGAFGDAANAEHAAEKVRGARLGQVQVVETQVNGKSLRRVRIGPLRDAEEADRLTPKLRSLGLGEPRVAVDN
jgi:rare lipoprotein A